MAHFIDRFIFSLLIFSFTVSGYTYSIHEEVIIPKIDLYQSMRIEKNNFTEQIRLTALALNKRFNTPILGIAPLGGSKLTAFKELDLDGLVILDWDRPGTPAIIKKTFTDAALQENLIKALEHALNNGSMSTSTVMQTSISAQLLSRLWYELGVQSVQVQFYQQSTDPDLSLKAWDGPIMEDNDPPLITRFKFTYEHKQRELIYLSSRITADSVTTRDSLPVKTLAALAPNGFQWSYHSADGMIFFSKKSDNGLQKGNQALLNLLVGGGAVVLDYPNFFGYNECLASEVYSGIASMCGRENLENWNLTKVATLPVNQPVFGYVGYTTGDEVRIYVKPSHPIPPLVKVVGGVFAMTNLQQVGETYEFNLKGIA